MQALDFYAYIMNTTKISVPTGLYDPGKLLDAVIKNKDLKTYARLAKLLEVDRCTLTQIKSRKLALSPGLLNSLQEVSGMSIREMRDLMDDRRREIRLAERVDAE
jgi:hypothetical protein